EQCGFPAVPRSRPAVRHWCANQQRYSRFHRLPARFPSFPSPAYRPDCNARPEQIRSGLYLPVGEFIMEISDAKRHFVQGGSSPAALLEAAREYMNAHDYAFSEVE